MGQCNRHTRQLRRQSPHICTNIETGTTFGISTIIFKVVLKLLANFGGLLAQFLGDFFIYLNILFGSPVLYEDLATNSFNFQLYSHFFQPSSSGAKCPNASYREKTVANSVSGDWVLTERTISKDHRFCLHGQKALADLDGWQVENLLFQLIKWAAVFKKTFMHAATTFLIPRFRHSRHWLQCPTSRLLKVFKGNCMKSASSDWLSNAEASDGEDTTESWGEPIKVEVGPSAWANGQGIDSS